MGICEFFFFLLKVDCLKYAFSSVLSRTSLIVMCITSCNLENLCWNAVSSWFLKTNDLPQTLVTAAYLVCKRPPRPKIFKNYCTNSYVKLSKLCCRGKKMLFNMLSRFVIASQFPIVSHPLLCTEYQRFFPSFTKKEKAIYEVEKPQGNRKLMKTQKWSYENNHCYAPSAY